MNVAPDMLIFVIPTLGMIHVAVVAIVFWQWVAGVQIKFLSCQTGARRQQYPKPRAARMGF